MNNNLFTKHTWDMDLVANTKYIDLFFVRLIFREGKYEGWYKPRMFGRKGKK